MGAVQAVARAPFEGSGYTATPDASRRRFQFSLRTLFVLVTIVAAPLAWLAVQLKWIHDRHDAWDWAMDYNEPVLVSLAPPEIEFPWVLRMLGEKSHATTLYFSPRTAEEKEPVSRVRALFPEANVLEGTAPWARHDFERRHP